MARWFRRAQRGKTILFGTTVYRLRVEFLLCNWIELCYNDSMLLNYHMHTVSHCTQFCWPIPWHDLRYLIWILLNLWCFYGSSWLGTTSSFRLGCSVLHGSLLTAIDSGIWIQSLYQRKCKSGQMPQIFWCVNPCKSLELHLSNDPSFTWTTALLNTGLSWFQGGRKILENVAK